MSESETDDPKQEFATAILHIRCTATDKETWIAEAKLQNTDLSKWVIEQLNNKGEQNNGIHD